MSRDQSSHTTNPPIAIILTVVASLGSLMSTGCQDGPLYALKAANPYFSMNEWKDDTELGVTDHERRKQLAVLADTIGSMSAQKQQFWSEQLKKMIESDTSPEMRRLAVRAAGNLSQGSGFALIEQGLDDDSEKVRMEACKSLGRARDEQSARTLASVAGTETSENVRHAALSALANHKNPIAVKALRLALDARDPATRDLAMQSLRGATGKDYGDDPQVWIAALDGKPTPQAETRIADRLRDLF
jgi:hypothetical protein